MEKEKKLQIIRAAAKRFDRHGLNKTTLDEVARDLRIGKATIYHYFESKDDLYFSVLEWEGNNLLDEIKNILSSEEMPALEKSGAYLSSKENMEQRYKLIYDTLVHLLSDTSLEPEVNFFSGLIRREEEILSEFFSGIAKTRAKQVDAFLTLLLGQSWNLLFTSKLNLAGSIEKMQAVKESFVKLIEEKLT